MHCEVGCEGESYAEDDASKNCEKTAKNFDEHARKFYFPQVSTCGKPRTVEKEYSGMAAAGTLFVTRWKK